jgi:hypothetical protein
MPRTIHVKAMPPKPVLQNKLYVAFHPERRRQPAIRRALAAQAVGKSDRGKVPMGWTLSPAMGNRTEHDRYPYTEPISYDSTRTSLGNRHAKQAVRPLASILEYAAEKLRVASSGVGADG